MVTEYKHVQADLEKELVNSKRYLIFSNLHRQSLKHSLKPRLSKALGFTVSAAEAGQKTEYKDWRLA